MQLIKRMRVVPVDTERYLLLNGLTGVIDLIDESVYQLYLRWREEKTISETEHPEMFRNFRQRGYLLEPHEEEAKIEELFNIMEQGVLQAQSKIEPTFLLTYNCNFRCSYCYEENVMTKGQDQIMRQMTPEMVDGLFGHFDAQGLTVETITLYGGEPLLHSNEATVRALLGQAQDRDLWVNVITNGYTLDYYAPILATAKIRSIQVTLDGDAERHNRSRYLANGEGTFERILRNLQIAHEYDLPVVVRCNIEVDEDGQVEKVAEALADYGLQDAPNVQLYIAPVAKVESQYQCGEDFLIDYLKRLDQFDDDSFFKQQALRNIHRVAVNFLDQSKWKPSFVHCGAHVSQQIFDPWGEIYPCQVLVGQKEHAIGTIDQSGKPQYNANFAKWQSRSVKHLPKCRDCELALFCGGGCGMRSLFEQGDVMQGNCASMRDLEQVFLPYLYEKYLK